MAPKGSAVTPMAPHGRLATGGIVVGESAPPKARRLLNSNFLDAADRPGIRVVGRNGT